MPRKILFTSLILLFSASVLPAAVGVSIEDNFFTPSSLTIPVGTTVLWTHNGNNTHTVTSGTPGSPSGLFDSGNLSHGKTFSFTFNNPGTIPYYCRIHGSMMTGSITVTCPTTAQLLKNRGFESGNVTWTSSPSSIINNTTTFPPNTGSWKAQLNGKGVTNTAFIYQQITIPSNACTAKLLFYLRVASMETTTTSVNDKLKVQILDSSGFLLKTLKTYSNLDKSSSYAKNSFSLIGFKGKTIRVEFLGTENSS